MTRRSVLRASAALLAALGSRAHGESQTHAIAIEGMKFGATADPLHVGDTLSFENHDMFRHTATARDGSFDLDLPPKQAASITLKTAGTLEVFCRFHPGMTAKFVVEP